MRFVAGKQYDLIGHHRPRDMLQAGPAAGADARSFGSPGAVRERAGRMW